VRRCISGGQGYMTERQQLLDYWTQSENCYPF
jgi:hypothetical protein